MITLRYTGTEQDEQTLIATIAINNGWTEYAGISQFEFAQAVILTVMKEMASQEAGEELTLDVVPVKPDVV
jgi:hypothetical protein